MLFRSYALHVDATRGAVWIGTRGGGLDRATTDTGGNGGIAVSNLSEANSNLTISISDGYMGAGYGTEIRILAGGGIASSIFCSLQIVYFKVHPLTI